MAKMTESEEKLAVFGVIVLGVGTLVFWPTIVVVALSYLLYCKFKNKKSIAVGAVLILYTLAIGLGFAFPNLSGEKLKDTYSKAPRITYPLVVPVMIGSELHKSRIGDKDVAYRVEQLIELKKKYQEGKTPLVPQSDQEISEREKVALGADYEGERDCGRRSEPCYTLRNPGEFSKVNYPSYLFAQGVMWLFTSKDDEKFMKDQRVKDILASWGLLSSSRGYYDTEYSPRYKDEDSKRVEELALAIKEIVP